MRTGAARWAALLEGRGVIWRFRQVRHGPDGFLDVSTDEGRLARLIPTAD